MQAKQTLTFSKEEVEALMLDGLRFRGIVGEDMTAEASLNADVSLAPAVATVSYNVDLQTSKKRTRRTKEQIAADKAAETVPADLLGSSESNGVHVDPAV